MGFTNLTQILTAAYSVVLGICCGIVYDIFRIPVLFFGRAKITVIITDLLFFLTCGIMFSIFSFIFCDGHIRLFCVLCSVVGAFFYRFTIGILTKRAASYIIKRQETRKNGKKGAARAG